MESRSGQHEWQHARRHLGRHVGRQRHRPRPGWRSDDGAAVIEFTVLVTLVLVPIVYLILAVMQVQSAAFGVTQAAREAGRAFAQADSVSQARADAAAAVAIALGDQGLTPGAKTLAIDCSARDCLAPGSQVTVRVAVRVRLPFLPGSLADSSVATIPVTAEHRVPIDTYRSAS
jgi:Flp pilus assembly protein TadG